MNVMSAAFDKAGIHPRDAQFNIAIAKYLNSGGDLAGAQALLDAAKIMSGEGQTSNASREADHGLLSSRQPIPGEATKPLSETDPLASASSGKPVEGEGGQIVDARNGPIVAAPSPSSNRGGRGQIPNGLPAQIKVAPSVREPSEAQRAASLSVAKISIMDTLKIDGRSFRDWGLGEAERAGRAKTRDGYILSASVKRARQHYANLTGSEKLGSLISEKQLQRIHQKAQEMVDAV